MQRLFEIQSMEHSLDSLNFTWNEGDGYYRVHKNGQQVYEGTAAEFTDGDLDPRHPFQYTIERVDDGKVGDVIVIQTSALTVMMEDEHPLQRLVITTIVAESQIALSWERIKGVEKFDVYRNGKYIATVEDNRFIDRETGTSETVTYSVSGTRPLIDSNQQLNVSKSIAAKAFELITPPDPENKPTEEIYTFMVKIDPKNVLLKPVAERKTSNEIDHWKFRYATFLKEDIIKNPNIFSSLPYFTGDDRDFDPEGKSFRTRVDIEGEFTGSESKMEFKKAVGPSIGLNYLKRYKRHGHGDVEGIKIERMEGEKKELNFEITHDVANPLTASPPIHYEVKGHIDREGHIDLVGYHNDAPHHEIYLQLNEDDWRTVHRAESEGLAYLSGVLGDNYWRYMTVK